ncbi:signal peptidase I [Paenibacillus dendritiformis]|jgi:signal peptidase I|uniref:signal peptidase I n=1 Tax=Paenibacillus dendritiformis TaxID=130049 RepID=UPI00387E0F00
MRMSHIIKGYVIPMIIAFGISLLIQQVAYAQVVVQQHSMQHTYNPGDRLIENKWVYHWFEPAYGDVVIIDPAFQGERYIKRIVGVAGDTIDARDGKLEVNGQVIDEPFAEGNTLPKQLELPIVVPEGHVFVMGDNRAVSIDSRTYGPVPLEYLEGKVECKVWPWW